MIWFVSIEFLWLVTLVTAIWLSGRRPIEIGVLLGIVLAGAVAAAAGLYCGFQVRWQPSATRRCVGFLFPAMIWRLENGRWVDYVGSPITAIMDVAIFVAVATLPPLARVVVDRVGRIL